MGDGASQVNRRADPGERQAGAGSVRHNVLETRGYFNVREDLP